MDSPFSRSHLGRIVHPGAINFITTLFNMPAPGMTPHKMPLFVVFDPGDVFPPSSGAARCSPALHYLLTDRISGNTFFPPAGGGNPFCFRIYSGSSPSEVLHPDSAGLRHDSQSSRLFLNPVSAIRHGYRCSDRVLGSLSGAHMYCGGISVEPEAFSSRHHGDPVPRASKIFSWIATMLGGSISLRTPMRGPSAYLPFYGRRRPVSCLANAVIDAPFMTPILWWRISPSAVARRRVPILAAGIYWFPKMTSNLFGVPRKAAFLGELYRRH